MVHQFERGTPIWVVVAWALYIVNNVGDLNVREYGLSGKKSPKSLCHKLIKALEILGCCFFSCLLFFSSVIICFGIICFAATIATDITLLNF